MVGVKDEARCRARPCPLLARCPAGGSARKSDGASPPWPAADRESVHETIADGSPGPAAGGGSTDPPGAPSTPAAISSRLAVTRSATRAPPAGTLGAPRPPGAHWGGPDAEKGGTSCAMSCCAFCRRNCANRKSAARFVRAIPVSSFCGLRPLANGGGGGRKPELGELFSALSCPPNSSCPSKESRTCLVPH
jgi:hypothetical protein